MADSSQSAAQPQTRSTAQTLAQHASQINEIIAEVKKLAKSDEATQAHVNKLEALNTTLVNQVTLLLNQPRNEAGNAPAQASNAPKKQQLPAPQQFDGTKWDTWKPYIEAKMEVDGGAIGGAQARFWYIYGCLNSKIQAMVLPLASSTATPADILAAPTVVAIPTSNPRSLRWLRLPQAAA